MNLNQVLNIWCDHIHTLVVFRNSKYQGTAINGFKEGLKTKPAYQAMKQLLNDLGKTNFELDNNNVDSTLFLLYTNTEPIEYSSTTYNWLERMINSKKILSKTLNDNQLNALNQQLEKAKSAFDNLEIDEPIEINQSNVKNDTLSPTSSNVAAQVNTQANLSITQQLQNFENMFIEKLGELNSKIEKLNSESNSYENKSAQQLTKLLSFRIKKRLLANNAIKVQNEYLKNNTAPLQIQADKFFTPYSYSTKFLTKMDEILAETQVKIINAIIVEINDKIEALDIDIEKITKCLEKFKTKNEIGDLCKELETTEESKLKKRFQRSLNKTKKPKQLLLNIYETKICDDLLVDNLSIVTENSLQSNISNTNVKNNNNKQWSNTNKKSILKDNTSNQTNYNRNNSRNRKADNSGNRGENNDNYNNTNNNNHNNTRNNFKRNNKPYQQRQQNNNNNN